MKTTVLLLFLCVFTTYASHGFSQEQAFTFSMKSASIKEICKEIEEKSDFIFVFSDNADRASNKIVNVPAKSESVSEVLDKILTNTGLTYKIIDKQIVIYEDDDVVVTPGILLVVPGEASTQQKPAKIKINGIVMDEKGLPLPGVNICLKSKKSTGTSTDLDGKFEISLPLTPNESLVFTFVGMKEHEIAISPTMKTDLKVVLKPNENELGELVVTGIFNKAKESFTGSASSIGINELQETGNRSLLSSIQSIDPSFNILQDITMGSNPNALPSINIRGSSSLTSSVRDLQEDNKNLRNANQPLFIMDGFEISLSRFMDMDENQVENVTLLKDNSATALYGSRGANGVVVITTKRPKEGRLKVNYRGSLMMEIPDLSSYNLLNAREKLEFEKAANLYYSIDKEDEKELNELYNKRKLDIERGVDTYWIKYPVRLGVGQKHSLNLDGGDKNIRYAVGLGYTDVEGSMKGSSRKTLNGNMFLQYQYQKLIFQNNLQIAQNHAMDSPYGTFAEFAKKNAYWTPYDEQGNLQKTLESYYYKSLQKENLEYNPLYNALLPQRSESKYLLITNNFSLEWRLNKDIFIKGRFSVSTDRHRSDYYVSAKNTMFDKYTGDDLNRRGRYTYGSGEFLNYEGDLTFNYSKLLAGKHQIVLGLSYNIAEKTSEDYTIYAEGISNIKMDFLGMASRYYKDASPMGTEEISRRVGAVLTGNYTYDNRYFLDISARGEASSKFGSNKRLAPFWSTGAGWNIHRESFLKENEIVNIARLRVSYGTSGAQNFSPYQAFTTFRDYSGSNYRGWNGVYMLGMGNPNLGWQITRQVNIGTEIELFQRRFRINVDVYDKTTDNLLADINLPTSSGFDSYKANVGKVLNKGFEASTNVVILRNKEKNASWSVGGSMIHNKNTIKRISNSLEYLNEKMKSQSNVNPSLMFQEGKPINTIYAVKSKGIDPSNGKEIFIKRDGTETYKWNSKDQVACGISLPKYQGNINTTLRYKGMYLNAIFGYWFGGQIYNYTLVNKVENIYPYDNADKRVLYDRWKKPGDIAFFKSVQDLTTTLATSRFVMDDNTLNLRSLSLGYEIPTAWLKKHLFLEYLSITGFTEDFFYISTIKQERGLSYPYSKKVSFSISARF